MLEGTEFFLTILLNTVAFTVLMTMLLGGYILFTKEGRRSFKSMVRTSPVIVVTAPILLLAMMFFLMLLMSMTSPEVMDMSWEFWKNILGL